MRSRADRLHLGAQDKRKCLITDRLRRPLDLFVRPRPPSSNRRAKARRRVRSHAWRPQRTRRPSLRSFLLGAELDIVKTARGRGVNNSDRSRVIHLAEAQRRIPGPAGEHAVRLLQHGTLDVALSMPVSPTQQAPHAQDEIYVVVRGRGVLLHDGGRDAFEAGDLLFVSAGTEHQFDELTEGFAVWRVFYGPDGGEILR